MAETDDHRELMLTLIETLKAFFLAAARVYVSGNLLVYYIPGDRRRHVSPDVFVVRGVPKHNRPYYLIWEEKPLQVVIELTSKSTRREDLGRKFKLYRDVLKVREYFLFDPHREYLKPQLQGYRLRKGQYVPIKPRAGRLPSKVLGVHLEASGKVVRLYNPTAGSWLPTPEEVRQQAQEAREHAEEALEQAEQARDQAEQALEQAAQDREQAEEARQQAEIENARLRQELDALRRQLRP
jgi:Uma2 family endonuclease